MLGRKHEKAVANCGIFLGQELSWKGLLSGNPFDRPEAALMITVDSLPKGKPVCCCTEKSA